MLEMGDRAYAELDEAQRLALQLVQRDKRIVRIAGVRDLEGENPANLNLVCRFEPEPDCNATGFFWIAFLMTRIEFEINPQSAEMDWPFDIGFSIGDDIFLPNGRILRASPDYILLWPPYDH